MNPAKASSCPTPRAGSGIRRKVQPEAYRLFSDREKSRMID